MDLRSRIIIAELGMTHDGSLGQAKAMIAAAALSGVDAVKLQMHISEAETIKNAPTPPYFNAEPRYEYFNRTAFDDREWLELKECAKENKVAFIVSPFSIEAIDRLYELGIDAFKVPSGEITNIPYLTRLAELDVPVILSSGMSTMDEVRKAVDIFLSMGRESKTALMQCTSEYPCLPENTGLNLIDEFHSLYPNLPIGFSDHTSGVWASIAAFTKGAKIIEKHFTLSKLMYGPDAKMSMEPDEMTLLTKSLKDLESALSNPVDKSKAEQFTEMRQVFQKSIVAKRSIPAGKTIEKDDLAFKKPGIGLETKYYKEILGKKVKKALSPDDIIYREDILW